MKHRQYSYVRTLVEANMPVLLSGVAGTGKSTLAKQIAEDLGFGFSSVSCTKQMSVNALLGFISINGVYIPSQLRKAYESGALFLLDEIDAADPNVLLCLNTIENGFISFPDGIVEAHPDFRLVATANPFDAHSTYTGRSKLDFSTIDRYFIVEIERDDSLEIALTSAELFEEVSLARSVLSELGSTRTVTMRDSIRMHKLSALGISDCHFHDVAFSKDEATYALFQQKRSAITEDRRKANRTQADCTTVEELWKTILKSSPSTAPSNIPEYEHFLREAKFYAEHLANGTGHTVPSDWYIKQAFSVEYMRYEYICRHGKFTHTFNQRDLDITPFQGASL